MKKKIISLICTVAMLLSCIGSVCFASKADYKEEDYIYIKGDFGYEKGTDEIVTYRGESDEVVIPENAKLKGLGASKKNSITKLTFSKNVQILTGGYYFSNMSSLKEVVFEDGIKDIDNEMFMGCTNLEKVTFSSTIETIGDFAFSKCSSLKTLELPTNLKSIGYYAFSDLKSLSGGLIFPESLEVLGEGAFNDCGDLNNVHLGENIKKFGQKYGDMNGGVFAGTHIKQCNIPDSMLNNPPTINADEITFNSDMTVTLYKALYQMDWTENKYLKRKTDKTTGHYEDFIVVDNTVLKYIGKDRNPVVPEGIKEIVRHAFYGADIDTVILPQSLEVIDQSAFIWTALKEITIPKKVKEIGMSAFDYCPLLLKAVIEGAPEIDGCVFAGSGGLEVELKDDSIQLPDDFYRFKEVVYEPWVYDQWTWVDAYKNKATPAPTVKASEKPTETNKPKESPAPTATAKPVPTQTPVLVPTSVPTAAPKLEVSTDGDITVKINGTAVSFTDAYPFVDGNWRTQIPVRAVSEAFNAEVLWEEEKGIVRVKKDGNVITLTVGSDILVKNDEQIKMDTAAVVIESRTYIPLRFLAQALGMEVVWNKK